MKMTKRPRSHQSAYFISAVVPEIRPGDFPVGSLESRAAARALLIAFEQEEAQEYEAHLCSLSPREQAFIEGIDDRRVCACTVRLLRAAEDREKAYGIVLPFPTAEKIRHNRKVAAEIQRLFGHEALDIQSSDSSDWKRMWAVADENVRSDLK
jgi:hypothetical protein